MKKARGFTPTSPRLPISLKFRRTSRRVKVVSPAFTIVELLVVIVVIGILAAITLVSYTGITQRATAAALTSDLANASKQLKLYQVLYGSYPTMGLPDSNGTICPTTPSTPDSNYCLKVSSGNTFTYFTTANGTTFSLTNEHNGTKYGINNASSPIALVQPTSCPTGFIPVPGSATYATVGFCVMKYEAKQVGSSTTPISTATGFPWVNISQTTAIANSANVAGCTSGALTCHLITEAEWMTIAQNVLSVASNWDNGAGVHTVGTGYIYSGNNDGVPGIALEASTDDTLGYTGTGNASGNQKRTLTLSNGEVIWDLAGNVYEWTNATIGANLQPGLFGEVAYAWKQWNNGSLLMNGLPALSQPSSTGIAGVSGWSSAQGIGQLYGNYGETGARAFLRGGNWNTGSNAGVLYLYLRNGPGSTNSNFGFRVAVSSGL